MEVSNDCINAIKQFEGFSSRSYKCPAGVYTIGYGHTGNVRPGMSISQYSATITLRLDLAKFENFINRLKLSVNQNQFDSLVDFTFNVGTGNFLNSTLYKLIKSKAKPLEIAELFKRWIYINDEPSQGLIKRRDWEYNKYLLK